MNLSVFIFTWNTETVRYNIDNGPQADFIDTFSTKVINANCDLVVVGLQEDSIKDSILLSDEDSLLVKSIETHYTLLKISSLSGWGVTTYKALKHEWDYRPRGLRLAVFKRNDLELEITDVDHTEIVCPGVRNWITAGKGGVVINVHTSLGTISFLNTHLPFSSRSIIQDPNDKMSSRHHSVMWQAKCLRSLHDTVVANHSPDYLFILGDLNFRVQLRNESGADEVVQRIFDESATGYIKELINEADELTLLFGYDNDCIPKFNEGVDNNGPMFVPTCKLKKGRKGLNVKSYKTGKKNQRTPSWCDRILYQQNANIKCVVYDFWDYGTMNCSDHAAVFGIYYV
jgi:hypothetical protein